MLINSPARLELLRHAMGEIREQGPATPDVQFYRSKLAEVFRRAGRSTAYAGIGDYSPAAFDALPITSKEALKARPWDFAVADLGATAKYYETTGTSGRVTPTPRKAEDVIWNVASVADAWRSLLVEDDRILVLLPSDVVPVGDLVAYVCEYHDLTHVRAYPFATGITDWDRLVTLFQAFQPTVLFSAPGVAVQLTRLLKRRDLLPSLRRSVRALMLLGEVSTEPLRGRLGAWWDATAYDASYGSTETGTLAASCTEGRLHLLTATNYFELVRDHRAVELSRSGGGRLVVTPLNLHARPLLRLDTGDEVTVGSGCPCGGARPTVMVHGRAADSIILRGVPLAQGSVEELVYGISTASGYQIELDQDRRRGRLLLERDVDADRADEPAQCASLQDASHGLLGLRWDEVLFVNTLPVTTKSGGSQKSWKRSNVRVVERVS